MEFFGMNLLKADRATWEKHIFSLNELGGNDTDYMIFTIGDYKVSDLIISVFKKVLVIHQI